MTDYTKLVEALRSRSVLCETIDCYACEAVHFVCTDKILHDAAATIEDLQAEADALVHDIKRYVRINAELTTENEALKSEVKKLKRVNLEIFEDLPKRGEWVEVDKITTYCSNCNWASYSMLVQGDAFLLRNNKTKYCPNCGAKMEVQE